MSSLFYIHTKLQCFRKELLVPNCGNSLKRGTMEKLLWWLKLQNFPRHLYFDAAYDNSQIIFNSSVNFFPWIGQRDGNKYKDFSDREFFAFHPLNTFSKDWTLLEPLQMIGVSFWTIFIFMLPSALAFTLGHLRSQGIPSLRVVVPQFIESCALYTKKYGSYCTLQWLVL